MAGDESSNRLLLQQMSLILEQPQLRDAMRVLNEGTQHGGADVTPYMLLVLDDFRDRLNRAVHAMQDAGDVDDERIHEDLPQLTIQALHDTLSVWNQQGAERVSQYGFTEVDADVGPTPAATAVVISLEKQTFHADAAGGEDDDNDDDDGGTECSICFEEFVEGEVVTVMPCPSHGHKFHPDCIANWLEMRNTCRLCRHELPTADACYQSPFADQELH